MCSIRLLADIDLRQCLLIFHVQVKWPRKWLKNILAIFQEQEHHLILRKVLTRAQERNIPFNQDGSRSINLTSLWACSETAEVWVRASRMSRSCFNTQAKRTLTEAAYNKIRPRHKQPPRIYGLPKIHKADVLIRTIVSCVNTFAYDLCAYLANILSPLTGSTDFTVNNSAYFVSITSSESILNNEIMVSFDVESLLTNVPIDAAVEAALQELENDPSLADHSTLTPAQIADLLNFVLRSTYF